MKESEILELKKSTSELKEGIISIVSILNKHQKGELYFGVKNNSEVVGQTVTEKTIRDISKSISDNIEPKIFPNIREVVLEGKKCVHLEFSGENVPYYAFGRAYIRVGDEDKKLSSQELEKLILKKNKAFWEDGISERTINDVNEKVLKSFIERANTVKRINFKFTNVKAILNKLELLKEDKLLKAGEVLFCDKNPLEVQAAVFAGTDKLTFLDIKQFKGNIFDLLEQSESYIKEHINWRAELNERVRKEIPEIPVRAITEALVNSLCHRDYENRKGNEVAIFKDRIEIYNPGLFPDGYDPKDFFKGTERSILRNPLIANTLYLSKDIERWGSGIKRIHDACKEEDVKVEFKKLKSGFLVIFYRKAEGPKRVLKEVLKGLTENQEKIISEVRKNPKITSEDLAKIVGISSRKIRDNMKKLKEEGLIKRVGGRKEGYWEVIK
ncbi:MAG: putative DNA binding domain-containing protein [Nanoarchaeota archaeon]|nr:putative DNA binding domain-containing protein [Nanoarchaeota archaeon]MBU1643652.1 putative DNA binding domain-containing protein [Nanoarchaeota archaeon]MBU1977355.1 putative DNA binding domain-containing protein [Nanoarchaeota archaeon]